MFGLKKSGVGWTAVLVLIVAAALAGYLLNSDSGTGEEHTEHEHAVQESGDPEIWSCSMDPQVRSPKPGFCPICGMDLVLLTSMEGAGASGGPTEVTLNERARKLAGVQVAPVERKPAWKEIRLYGKVEYDETSLAHITAWVPGRIDNLHVDFTGTFVEKGAPLADFYSPELLVAQEELLQLLQVLEELKGESAPGSVETAAQTVEAARKKLELQGLTEEQVREVEERGTPSDQVTILAPIDGTVIDKEAMEGLYMAIGTCLFTLADLTSVWVKLDAYEYDIQWIREGQDAAFQVEALPGETFLGTVKFVDPVLDETTRTVKVRLDVENPEGKLKPGMFVKAMISSQIAAEEGSGEENPLVIPASAALITGKRAVVYVALPEKEGTYEGREVVLGPRAGDLYVVRQGLAEGEEVVVNGNFKIDSALQLLAKPSMMSYEGEDR